MRRTILVVLIVLAACTAAFSGWQMAYAQGEAAGRAAVQSARGDFIQGRGGGGSNGGGNQVGRNSAGQGQPGGRGGQPAGQAGQGQAGGNRVPLMAGTIDKVDGSTITLATDSGSLTVTMTDQTQVRRQVSATPSDLKPGERVTVIGPRSAAGAVAATAIQIQGQ